MCLTMGPSSNQATLPALPIVVLGAGCAGLSAAYQILRRGDGRPVVVLEMDDHVGGLAGGVTLNGNIYEYGPHIFHTTDPQILADVKEIVGKELLPYKRTIQIKFLKRYFSFPLQMRDVLLKLPPLTVLHAGLSLAWHFTLGMIFKPKVETSETILKRYYGEVLYQIFFKSYIEGVWGISPNGFSPSFARERIPRMNTLELLDKLASGIKKKIKGKVRTDHYVEKVEGELYTTKKGFSLIAERFQERLVALGGSVRLNAEVTGVELQGDRVVSVRYKSHGETYEIQCSGVVNTLPINLAVRMFEPTAPAHILDSAEKLKFRGLVFVGLLIRKPKVLPASFMYFREHSFNRVSDLSQMGFEVTPSGCTLVVAEISCSPKDAVWKDEAMAKEVVLKDLKAEGFFTDEEVLEVHVFRAEHAYPIYTLNYEQHLKTLLDYFGKTRNLMTAGRQGRFQYVNTHIAMKMGYEAADELLERLRAPGLADESPLVASIPIANSVPTQV